tara:strand:- start:147 stop:386 length:240 start_codon:yes stop_codon:yes gene_type:complete
MSHVTALPAPTGPSFDESAAEVAHYAISTLHEMDVTDIAVTAVGFAAGCRILYTYFQRPNAYRDLLAMFAALRKCRKSD